MNRVIDRFDKYMKDKGLNDNQVTIDLSLSIGLLGKSRKGERDLSKKSIEKILNFYTDINPDWLQIGKGNMLKSEEFTSIPQHSKEGYRSNGDKGVPYYDIDITATITESFSDVKEIPLFYVDFQPFNDCSVYLPIWGDSMLPIYSSGDIVALKKLNNPDVIQWGEAYLVITGPNANNMRTVKLLYPHKDEDKIILRASNPSFAGDTIILKKDILSIYIVKGKITRKQL
jgi:phage repressor protein C with HTH and peptisase S24 domain